VQAKVRNAMTSELLPRDFCPYKGLQPYTEQDRDYFFGRERDQEVIVSNLYAASLTVLYGVSGVGKSSVLRAGVAPLLEQTPHVIVVVFREWQDKDIGQAFRKSIIDGLDRAVGKGKIRIDPALPLDDFLSKCNQASDSFIFLILDQFEEYFLYHSGPSAVDFDAELARAINRTDIEANFLLAIREDGLSKLDRFRGRIPNLLSNRLRLEHLNREAAINAIRKPLEQYNRHLPSGQAHISVEDQLVDALVEEVKTGRVTIHQAGEGQVAEQDGADVRIETPFLQMVLTRLWDEETRQGSRNLRLSTLRQLGGVERIVRTHLDKVMEQLSPSEQEVAARLFRFLVTPTGSKIAFSTEDLVGLADLPRPNLEPVLVSLSSPEIRILRPIAPPPDRPAELRYEIFHDVLASAVLDWRARFVAEQQRIETERKRAEEAEQQQRELAKAQAEAEAERHRAEEQAKSARFNRVVAWAAGLSALVFLGLLVYALHLRNKAEIEGKESLAHWLAGAARTGLAEGSVSGDKAALQFAERAVFISQSAGPILRDAEEVLRSAIPAQPKILNLPGHPWPISQIVYSPDGSLLASMGLDGIRIWDTRSREQVHFLKTSWPLQCTNKFAFSGDSKKFTCSMWSRQAIWDLASEARLAIQPSCASNPKIDGFSLSSDGRLIALDFECADGNQKPVRKVGVWNTSSDPSIRRTPSEGHGAIFGPQGETLAWIVDKTVELWDGETSKSALIPAGEEIQGISFNADGTRIDTLAATEMLVWDSSGHRRRSVSFGEKPTTLIFSPDGKRAASTSEQGRITVFDTSTGQVLSAVHACDPFGGFSGLEFSGDALVARTRSGTQAWNAITGIPLPPPPAGKQLAGNQFAFSPDGRHLAVADDTAISISDELAPNAAPMRLYRSWLSAAAFSPDGKQLATLLPITNLTGGRADVWNTDSGETMFRLRTLANKPSQVSRDVAPQADGFTRIAYSPTGKLLATTTAEGVLQLWNGDSGTASRTLATGGKYIQQIVFSPDGKTVATLTLSDVSLWKTESGEPVKFANAIPGSGLFGVAFSSDGKVIVTAGRGGLDFWDASSGRSLGHLGLEEVPLGAAYSPDGKHLAAWGRSELRLWDYLSRDKPVPTTDSNFYSEPVFGVSGVVFSTDGNWLAISRIDLNCQYGVAAKGGFSRPNCFGLSVVDLGSQHRDVLDLAAQTAVISSIAFTQDDKIHAAARDGSLYVYPTSVELLMAEAKNRQPGPLSKDECSQFHLDPDTVEACQAAELVVKARQDVDSNIKLALKEFKRASVLDPVAELDPKSELAQSLVADGNKLAAQGNWQAAASRFREALEYNPKQQFDPEKRAKQAAASYHVQKGRNLASQGDAVKAAAEFQQAVELDPRLKLNPQAEAEQLEAGYYVAQGRRLASTGDQTGAIAQFKKALQLDRTLKLDPQAEANRIAARLLVTKGIQLARGSQVPEAIGSFEKAQELDPTQVDAVSLNELCWLGSVEGHAADVLFACDKAVALDPQWWSYKDSRGLARALTGDSNGAIKDFEVTLAQPQLPNENEREERKEWIKILRQVGKLKFTTEQIAELRRE
jgi:WD40 repeat protein/tetratricopeptide (TPR) repeat protein